MYCRTTADAESSLWWQRAVIYENHLPSFRDGNGDGIGDLVGLTMSLDYLSDALGVDAVWVGPFYRSPLLDQGYDISDHCDVEPVFGTMADFDRLIVEAHLRSIRVIVDFVPNHTSDQHPWFVESRSSRSNAHRDWYVWRDPAVGGGPPNNWTSEAGGSVWELDDLTGQYYLHSHLIEQPDLNWRNAEVRGAMLDVLRFWLDRGADGVRIDVAHMLMKDPEFRDNPVREIPEVNEYDLQHADFATQHHINDRGHRDVFDVLREIRRVVDCYPDRICIGEIEGMPWADWAKYFGEQLDVLHMPFAFRLIETPWQAGALADEVDAMLDAAPADAWAVLALGNHDRPRLASRLGQAQARVAAIMLLTLPGTPTLLYGDELGLEDQPVPAERQRDRFARMVGGVSRDPTRTPMPWTSGRNGGFSEADERLLWLPISKRLTEVAVSTQIEDDSSSLALYRRVLALRRRSPALTSGAYRRLVPVTPNEDVWVYERGVGEERKVVALNFGQRWQRTEVITGGEVVVSTVLGREGRAVAERLELAPNEAVIVNTGAAHHRTESK
ncbi:MAG: DUF3459 domain-containing protein [Acidimicrobiia bacterium]|nr:DUF3459 domain-containing protein [Acidimicrobiia bacterium]